MRDVRMDTTPLPPPIYDGGHVQRHRDLGDAFVNAMLSIVPAELRRCRYGDKPAVRFGTESCT